MYSKTRPCRAITKTSAHNLFPYEQAFKSTWVKCLASNKHGLMTSWSIFFSLNVVRTIVFPFKDLLRVASRSRLKVGKKSNWRGEGEQQHSWLNLQPRPCAYLLLWSWHQMNCFCRGTVTLCDLLYTQCRALGSKDLRCYVIVSPHNVFDRRLHTLTHTKVLFET